MQFILKIQIISDLLLLYIIAVIIAIYIGFDNSVFALRLPLIILPNSQKMYVELDIVVIYIYLVGYCGPDICRLLNSNIYIEIQITVYLIIWRMNWKFNW